MPPQRTCGDATGRCVACCKTNVFEGLDKPEGSWCKFCAIGKGCGLFASPARPKGCGEYKCAWLWGAQGLQESDRPDKLGVIIDQYLLDNLPGPFGPRVVGMLRLTERKEGAFKNPRPRKIIENQKAQGGVVWLRSFSATDTKDCFEFDGSKFSPLELEVLKAKLDNMEL